MVKLDAPGPSSRTGDFTGDAGLSGAFDDAKRVYHVDATETDAGGNVAKRTAKAMGKGVWEGVKDANPLRPLGKAGMDLKQGNVKGAAYQTSKAVLKTGMLVVPGGAGLKIGSVAFRLGEGAMMGSAKNILKNIFSLHG